MIELTIDGVKCIEKTEKTILEVARQKAIAIPTLCHLPKKAPRAVCRLCVVEVIGRPGLACACSTPISQGMEILTQSEKVKRNRKTLMEFILAEHGELAHNDEKIQELANELLNVKKTRFSLPTRDFSHYKAFESEYIKLEVSKCIHCDRCIRTCEDRKVITRKGFGRRVTMAFDNDISIDESSCVQCGDCIHACPSGAISAA